MKYLSKRFTGKYGFWKFLLLLVLIIFGSLPASISIIKPDINKNILYIIAGFYLVFTLIFYAIFYRKQKIDRNILYILKVILLAIAAIYALSYALDFIFGENVVNPKNQEQIETMLQLNFSPALVFYMVLMAPAVEEYTFREFFPGVFRKIFTRRDQDIKDFLALVLSNIIFSLLHIPTDLYSFLVYFSLGFVLVMVRYITNNLKLSALVHTIWNLISVVILYFVL